LDGVYQRQKMTKTKGLKKFSIGNSITVRDTKAIKSYFYELNTIDTAPMQKDQEIICFEKYQNGCKKSGERILHSNLRFVVSVAKAFHRGNPCLEVNDLIQCGNIGLMTAMRKYDISKGFKFISYAVWWIRQHILEEIKNNSNTIKIPQNARHIQGLQDTFVSKFYNENGFNPSHHEIAQALSTTKENIMFLNNSCFVKSIDDKVADDDSPVLKDIIQGESNEFDKIFADDVSKSLEDAFKCLKEKERHVLSKLYNLNDEDKSVGLLRLSHEMGKTREGIRQLRNRALEKISKYSIENNMELLNFW